MSRLEKRLCVFAIVFVTIYVGAVVLTIHSRVHEKETTARIESVEAGPGEGQMMLAELLLPMLILFTLTVCFLIIKKKRAKTMLALDAADDEFQ